LLSIGVRAAWRPTGIALAMGQVLSDRLLAGGDRSLEVSGCVGRTAPHSGSPRCCVPVRHDASSCARG